MVFKYRALDSGQKLGIAKTRAFEATYFAGRKAEMPDE
jgi:hypothetical protein